MHISWVGGWGGWAVEWAVSERVVLEALADEADPMEVLRRWPRGRSVCALVSGDERDESRWTVIAEPTGWATVGAPGAGSKGGWLAAVAGGPAEIVGDPGPSERPVFVGGWLLALEYELGYALEPRARGTASGGAVGGGELGRVLACPRVLAYDRVHRRWWRAGPGEGGAVGGEAWASPDQVVAAWRGGEGAGAAGFSSRRREVEGEQAWYERGVARVLSHIVAGDVYQLNLTRRMDFDFAGDSRAMMAALVRRARPWYGAYLELAATAQRARRAVASVSPEMFLEVTPTGEADAWLVRTRPMKGTRLVGVGAVGASGAAASALRESEKERAELCMIVDLMRNDLGRVCEVGSVRVEAARAIEPHAGGTLLQATATVAGVLRGPTSAGAALEVLVRAGFAPGSVTGAPKVRAMQIIGELERGPRGLYCGSLGFVSRCGRAGLNVAIRTAVVEAGGADAVGEAAPSAFGPGSKLSYGVGAGIVADSEPGAEWRETCDKAQVLVDVLGMGDVR